MKLLGVQNSFRSDLHSTESRPPHGIEFPLRYRKQKDSPDALSASGRAKGDKGLFVGVFVPENAPDGKGGAAGESICKRTTVGLEIAKVWLQG